MEYSKTFSDLNLERKNAFIVYCLLFILIIILASLVVFYISNHITIVSLGYKIIKLENMKSKLEEQNRKYELVVDTLSALDRIETIATNQMGMIRPKKVEFVAFNTKENYHALKAMEKTKLLAEKADYFYASVDIRGKNNLILGVLK